MQLNGCSLLRSNIGRADLDGLHRFGDRERMTREQDGMPVIRQKDPSGEQKAVLLPARLDRAGQASKFGLGENPPLG